MGQKHSEPHLWQSQQRVSGWQLLDLVVWASKGTHEIFKKDGGNPSHTKLVTLKQNEIPAKKIFQQKNPFFSTK